MATPDGILMSIEQLNAKALELQKSQPTRAEELFNAAIAANETYRQDTSLNDYHVVTSYLQLSRLLAARGEIESARSQLKEASMICFSLPSSVRQAFLPAIKSETAIFELQSSAPKFDEVADILHKNVKQNQVLANQSKADRRQFLADLVKLGRTNFAPPVVAQVSRTAPSSAHGSNGTQQAVVASERSGARVDRGALPDAETLKKSEKQEKAAVASGRKISDAKIPVNAAIHVSATNAPGSDAGSASSSEGYVGRQPSPDSSFEKPNDSAQTASPGGLISPADGMITGTPPVESAQKAKKKKKKPASESLTLPKSDGTATKVRVKRKIAGAASSAGALKLAREDADEDVEAVVDKGDTRSKRSTKASRALVSGAEAADASSGAATRSLGNSSVSSKRSKRTASSATSLISGDADENSPKVASKKRAAVPQNGSTPEVGPSKRPGGLKFKLGGFKIKLGLKKQADPVASARAAANAAPEVSTTTSSKPGSEEDADTRSVQPSKQPRPQLVLKTLKHQQEARRAPSNLNPVDAAAADTTQPAGQQNHSALPTLTKDGHSESGRPEQSDPASAEPPRKRPALKETDSDSKAKNSPLPSSEHSGSAEVKDEQQQPAGVHLWPASNAAPAHVAKKSKAAAGTAPKAARAHGEGKTKAAAPSRSPRLATSRRAKARAAAKKIDPAQLVEHRRQLVALRAAQQAAEERKADALRTTRQIHELEICRAKLTAQQKLLSSNAHPGQTQRVAVLEKRFRSELRKIQREAEWRNVAVRETHRLLSEGRDIACDSKRHKQKNVVRKYILQRLAELKEEQALLQREAKERAREKKLADEAAGIGGSAGESGAGKGSTSDKSKNDRPSVIRRSSRARSSRRLSAEKDDDSNRPDSRGSKGNGGSEPPRRRSSRANSGKRRGADKGGDSGSGSGSDSDSDATQASRSSARGGSSKTNSSSSGGSNNKDSRSSSSARPSKPAYQQTAQYEGKVRQHERLRRKMVAVKQNLGGDLEGVLVNFPNALERSAIDADVEKIFGTMPLPHGKKPPPRKMIAVKAHIGRGRLSVFKPKSSENGSPLAATRKGTSSRPGANADTIIDEGDFVVVRSGLSDHEFTGTVTKIGSRVVLIDVDDIYWGRGKAIIAPDDLTRGRLTIEEEA